MLSSTLINIFAWLDSYIGMGFKAVGVTTTLILLPIFILKVKPIQAIISSVIYTMVLGVGDVTAVFLMVKTYGYTHEMIKSNLHLSITSDLIIYGSAIIIIFIIRLISQSRDMASIYKRKTSLRTSFYMLLTFSIVAINYSIYIKFIGILDKGVVMINVAAMWIYLILSIYYNFTNSALALKEQQYDQQQDYIKTIDSLVNDFRRLKHSHANTIYSIYGFIQENDMEGLKQYYSEIMDETKKMDNSTLLAIQKIKLYAIFGLLWSKVNEAESLGINIGVQVSREIHEAGMKLTDLCEVLGNYLDNAIEAAACSEDKRINVSFSDDDSYLTINVENTFIGDVDTQKIYQKGYSTKGKDRGHGLAITKQILSKYANVLHNTVNENNIFIQEIVIKK
ncbi:MAG: sensor histidine kinase [Caulobacteraceae bacterium]